MKYVKIAYFDMLAVQYVFLCGHALRTDQNMNFTVEPNGACVRPVAPQAALLYAAPARTCMHDLDKRRNSTWFAWNIIRLLCNHHMVHITGDRSGTEPVEFHNNQGQEAAPLAWRGVASQSTPRPWVQKNLCSRQKSTHHPMAKLGLEITANPRARL